MQVKHSFRRLPISDGAALPPPAPAEPAPDALATFLDQSAAHDHKSCDEAQKPDNQRLLCRRASNIALTKRDGQRLKSAPADFAETFVRHGWRGVEEAYGARTAVNKRWLAECGGADLKAARLVYRFELAKLRSIKC